MPVPSTLRQILGVVAIWVAISAAKIVLQRFSALDPAMLERADGFLSACAVWWVCRPDSMTAPTTIGE